MLTANETRHYVSLSNSDVHLCIKVHSAGDGGAKVGGSCPLPQGDDR